MADDAHPSWFARARTFVTAPHVTPRYALAKARLSAWQRRHPDAPWLSRQAVEFLDQWLRPTDEVVEFGSGRSTAWLAARTARVVSVEHDAAWHAEVRVRLGRVPNAVCLLRSVRGDEDSGVSEDEANAYVRAPESEMASAPTVVLVDGKVRARAALWALDHVQPGGLVLIDNANWYLPGPTRAPSSVSEGGAPTTPAWSAFWQRAEPLRRLWFTDDVTATLAVWK